MTILMVYSPELAQSFLKSGDLGHLSKPKSVFYKIMKPFLGNSLLFHNGQLWRDRRKLFMRSMSFQNLRNYMSLLNKHSHHFVSELDNLFGDGQIHQINSAINSIFLAIITEIVTGSDISETNKAREFHENFQSWKNTMMCRLEKIWLHSDFLWNFNPQKLVHDEAVASIRKFSLERLLEHKKRREEKQVEIRNILDELIDAGATDEEIINEINTLLSGGHEMSAATVHMFLLLMTNYPHHQDACRNEIDRVFEDKEQTLNGNFTFEALSSLKYLERCLLETMRLLPPVFAFMRELKVEMKIEYNGNQVNVPVGTQVAIVPWAIHRNEDYWPNPETFNPDRFLPEECAKGTLTLIFHFQLDQGIVSSTDRLEDVPLLPRITITPERDYNFVMKRRAF
ncbi:Cytochrome P450 4c3 [Orchesella cincta]|uniref:Cytochrome P450 4c3 n=1 Tax=Orchesella cincta TaxID=48709 RepID=A0A1D2M5J6_ORCCI|nr:Cytochrome P450 4c3 [Orchesella cincta]